MNKTLPGLLFVFLISFSIVNAGGWKKKNNIFREELNEHYLDPEDSPLDSVDRIHFEGHEFFELNKKFCVKADLVLTPDAEPFEMQTVSGKIKMYVKYGEARFKIDGKAYSLALYQSLKFREMEEYKDDLFLPFKDHTNGNESYGGGRYIDLKIPKGKKIVIDFNQCYNPYCAYSSGWSCPIPPDENHLDVAIPAGIRAWKEH